MNIDYIAQTHIGNRPKNEDYHIEVVEKKWALFAVADGCGGYPGGEWAAKVFCELLSQLAKKFYHDLKKQPIEAMRKLIIVAAQEMTLQLQEANYENAHTTCAIAWLDNHHLMIAHIGDSRVYLFNDHEIIWHTKDHSIVQRMVNHDDINESQMGTHPAQNQLLQAIGPYFMPTPEIHLYPPLDQNECLLLCTDGFWEHITPDEIVSLAKTQNPETDLKKLISLALDRGKPNADNITVQWVKV